MTQPIDTLTLSAAQVQPEDAIVSRAVVDAAVDAACRRIAPLWPLQDFVAVNPFLGFADRSFTETSALMTRVTGGSMLADRAFYRAALAKGAITDDDLAAAVERLALVPPPSAAEIRTALAAPPSVPAVRGITTVAAVLDQLSAGDREASRVAFMIDEISKWCAAYFDRGQAAWAMPQRDLAPYAAWRASMRHNLNPAAMGITGFRETVATMPDDPREAIRVVVAALGIPAPALTDYFHRALHDIGGWAGYVRQLAWIAALDGRDDDRLTHLLAIRVVWGYTLFCGRQDETFRAAWAAAMRGATWDGATPRPQERTLPVEMILQEALEIAYQRGLVATVQAPVRMATSGAQPRSKTAQAVFCIDVRSEVLRRHLEAAAPNVETFGFAGFFGLPIAVVGLGDPSGEAQCPVLLKPSYRICEALPAGADATTTLQRLNVTHRLGRAWKGFRASANSAFAYVEALGLGFAARLITDSFAWGNAPGSAAPAAVELAPARGDAGATGLDAATRLTLAEGMLRGMSLTRDFAPVVLLLGHGSSSANNPHAAGLACGACGGHAGGINARVAAAILNDAAVRDGLRPRGISIPAETRFVAGEHNTTTDVVQFLDLPPDAGDAIAELQRALETAGAAARRERAPRLGLEPGTDLDRQITGRGKDWAQVRPEWGLAGNAAFIAAPAGFTTGLDLRGRAFLHTYDWRRDSDFAVLTAIMTAPMVVASWINLQYFASSANNRIFGAGNKVLHNVVGGLGVLEGNGGDLKAGLPWQSVHDGNAPAHEPLRLNVMIAAPRAAIARVLEAQAGVRDLVENRWVHLFAIDDDRTVHRYAGAGAWRAA